MMAGLVLWSLAGTFNFISLFRFRDIYRENENEIIKSKFWGHEDETSELATGEAVTAADDRKKIKYRDLSQNHYIVLFGVETLGIVCYRDRGPGQSIVQEIEAIHWPSEFRSIFSTKHKSASVTEEGTLHPSFGPLDQ
ncbi:hypothetical protein ACOME3_008943 [Neoechinorhynchus agilis]